MNEYRKLFDPNKRYFIDTNKVECVESGVSELLVVHPHLEKVGSRYRWVLIPESTSDDNLVFHVYRPFQKGEQARVCMVWYHDIERRLESGSYIGEVSCVHEFDSIDSNFDELMSWMK